MDRVMLWVAIALFGGAIGYAAFGFIRGRRDEVRKRLERYTEGLPEGVAAAQEAVPAKRPTALAERLDQALAGRGFGENIRTQLARANLKLTAGEYLAATVVCVILFAATIHLVRRSPILTLAAGVLGFFAPRWYVAYLQGKRLKSFNNQLGDTINLLVNSIRSGYSVLQAMETVAREMGPPISEEFDRVVREVQFGLSMEEALDNMVRRVPSDDLDLMITAVKVQREVGGNLAEVLDAISFTIRERVRIKGEIRALTAMGRGSGFLISFLPIGVIVFLTLINPEFMGPMFEDPCGWVMLGVAGLGIILGFIIIQKIVDIEV